MLRNTLAATLILVVVGVACAEEANTPSPPPKPTTSTDLVATATASATESKRIAGVIATATAYAQSLQAKATAEARGQTTPKPAPNIMVVGNTGGVGVYVRRTPSMADKLKAWPDRTIMKLTGEQTEAEGKKWLRVEAPDGNNGWIPAEYLVAPTATP
ncbi:MAG: hypothetical protein ABIH46_03600 [Chloroflexota bacterium]